MSDWTIWVAQALCFHRWEWWVNYREPKKPGDEKKKTKVKYDASI